MRFNLIILMALLLVTPAKSQTERPDLAFGHGEKLEFVVSYRAKLWPNTEVGDVVLTTSRERDRFTIVGHGRSRSFFRWFFDLNDTYTTVMEVSTLLPITFSERTRQNKYHFNNDLKFDWSEIVVHSTWRNVNRHTEDRHKTMPITEHSVDVISLFYRLRNTDISTLRISVPMPLEMILKDTIRTVHYRFLGREELNVSGLGRFRTLKFSCTFATSDGENFVDGSEFFIWVSDDNNRIPLQIESPIRVGSVRIRLKRHSGLRHPLDSKIK
ncbi:MAG: DUF3108 domain-containing protein [Bacteroidales bacterium]|jgi:hypothetical protein|nr:DUF3108 domain-containing protein [Bacteroidales bacterium]